MHCALQAYSHTHTLFFHRQGVSWATCSRDMHRELPTRGFREGEGAVVWKWPSKVQAGPTGPSRLKDVALGMACSEQGGPSWGSPGVWEAAAFC